MENCLFDQFFGGLFKTPVRSRPKAAELRNGINELIKKYIAALDDVGSLTPEQVRQELCAVFQYMRDECELYGRGKRYIRMNILRILHALDLGIRAKKGEYLLAKWRVWEDMLNPASPYYIGIDLPGSMIIDGYLVFEDFITLRRYFENEYDDGSFNPKHRL
jgi:uncharacterized protein YceK